MTLLNPYVWLAAALALLLTFFGGCHVQKGREADKRQALNTTIDGLQASLRGTAKVLRAVDAESKARIKAAEDAALNALDAGEAAAAEEKRQDGKVKKAGEDFDRRLLIAQRRAACKAWLDTNVAEVCGI